MSSRTALFATLTLINLALRLCLNGVLHQRWIIEIGDVVQAVLFSVILAIVMRKQWVRR